MFTNVKDVINWIENIARFERRKDLARMKNCLALLDNPENEYKKVHIAGTNGKGSVAMMFKNILLECNFKVGVFVSPYVVCFNERIQINNEYITDEDLIHHTNIIYNLWQREYEKGQIITFFEVLTLICFNYFKAQKIDYAIIEVGLGGILDATNVINADLSIITNIGFDHMGVLGNTLEEIALNKLGILKENNYLITMVDESLLPLFKNYVDLKKAKMLWLNYQDAKILPSEYTKFIYRNISYELKLIGIHQAYNAMLAIEGIKYLLPNIESNLVAEGLKKTSWPGRMELMQDNPHVIIDGAHNIHGAKALYESIKKLYVNRKIHFIISALADKETEKMIHLYQDIATSFTFTEFDYHRVKNAECLYNECSHQNKQIIIDPFQAISLMINHVLDDECIIITGSLYFISLVRPFLLKK